NVLVDSLIEFGLSAEFVGRIPTIAPLAPLNREELRKCLCDIEHSPVKRQEKLFSECGYEIEFESELLDSIVEEALKMATGTR
ncbi:ATP-dependent Clp protease ATP-binding subunit ClpX, partial [Klebsiella pneumoniae]